MPDNKPSIRELVWLASRRQAPLFNSESGSEPFDGSSPECEDPDCLPWVHTLKQCERLRERVEQKVAKLDKTPAM